MSSTYMDNARFEDIRVGDTITATFAARSGLTYTTTGIVERIDGDRILGGRMADSIIVYQSEVDGGIYTLTIVKRPLPAWKRAQYIIDRNDDAWSVAEGKWFNITSPDTLRFTMEELDALFGPLRRAKIVEASS